MAVEARPVLTVVKAWRRFSQARCLTTVRTGPLEGQATLLLRGCTRSVFVCLFAYACVCVCAGEGSPSCH